MLESGVPRTRIHHRSKPYLVDAIEALHQRMAHNLIEDSSWYLDESENWVVDDGAMIHGLFYYTGLLQFFGHLLLKLTCLVASHFCKVLFIGGINDTT